MISLIIAIVYFVPILLFIFVLRPYTVAWCRITYPNYNRYSYISREKRTWQYDVASQDPETWVGLIFWPVFLPFFVVYYLCSFVINFIIGVIKTIEIYFEKQLISNNK